MTYKKSILLTGCALFALAIQAQVTIDIDTQQRGPKVSPMLYGIFYEDINHAADGGIYAELIRNRSHAMAPLPICRDGRPMLPLLLCCRQNSYNPLKRHRCSTACSIMPWN